MTSGRSSIIFVDNTVNQIHQTIDVLTSEYGQVQVFTRESELFDFLGSAPVDVIFLNLDLHPNDALTVLKEINQNSYLPRPFIIIYSDKKDDFVQELAFNSGADSFVAFHRKPAIMNAFIKNLLRRKVKVKAVRSKAVFVDPEKYLVYKNGLGIQLAKKEFQLFEMLYNKAGTFFTKLEIAETIWNDEKIAKTRTIDVHVYNIRQFLGRQIIQTQKGRGYRMNRKLIT